MNSKIAIKSIRLTAPPTLCPITPETETNLRRAVPNGQWSGLDKRRDLNDEDGRDYWLLIQDMTVALYLAEGGCISLTLKKGWITDLGSVPLWARSIVSSSDPKFNLAYIVHDALCATHYLDFEATNSALVQIAKIDGAGWFKRIVVGQAISLGGHGPWLEQSKHIEYERKWCSFSWGAQ